MCIRGRAVRGVTGPTNLCCLAIERKVARDTRASTDEWIGMSLSHHHDLSLQLRQRSIRASLAESSNDIAGSILAANLSAKLFVS